MSEPTVEPLSVARVVAEYGIPRSTVYEHIKSGAWDGFVSKVGKTYVLRDGLETWIANGGTRECHSISCDRRTAATGTLESRVRTAREPVGKAPAKRLSETLSQLLDSGTRLNLRDIPSSRLSKRSNSSRST